MELSRIGESSGACPLSAGHRGCALCCQTHSDKQRVNAGRGRASVGAAVGAVAPVSIMCATIARATGFIEARAKVMRELERQLLSPPVPKERKCATKH